MKKFMALVLAAAMCMCLFAGCGSSWETTPYPFAVLASRRSEKYDPRSGEQMPCVELEHIEQETGRIIVAFHRHNKAVLKVSVSPGILSLGSYALI